MTFNQKMVRWVALSTGMFAVGSETSSLLYAAKQGQDLTDRGVWIGLLILLMIGIIWFAKVQFAKEDMLISQQRKTYEDSTARVEKISEQCSDAIRANTLALKELQMTFQALRDQIHQIDEHQQAAAREAEARDRRRRGAA